MAARQPSLKVGDRVSVYTRVWGGNWAQSVHGDDWKAGRTYGKVVANDSAKWVCDFGEKDGKHASWRRSTLRFEKRAEEPPAPMTVEEVYAAATAEGLVLHASDGSETGYRCVVYDATAGCRPFKVRVSTTQGKKRIGSFATAEEAALCYARHVQENGVALPENAPKKRRQVVYQPRQNSMSAADALAAASAEGLVLQTAPKSASDFAGVKHDARGFARPFSCEVGSFRTAEEAALAIARKRESSSRSDEIDSLAPSLTLAAAPPAAGCLEPEVPRDQDAVIHVSAVQVLDSDGENGTVTTGPGPCSCCTATEHRIRVIEMKIAAAQRLNDAELVAIMKQQLVDL